MVRRKMEMSNRLHMQEMQGKRALVTASSQGLGKAVAAMLAARGAKVFICSRDADRIRLAAEEIERKTGRKPHHMAADVSDKEQIDRLIETAASAMGGIDILVNNTGGPPAGRFDDFSDDQWVAAHESLLLSVVRLVRCVLPFMKAQGSGSIVNIVSTSVKQPISGLILSNTYRAAVVGLAKTLAEELGPYGIRINNVAPGRIDTDRIRSLDAVQAEKLAVTAEDIRRRNESAIPLRRYGSPEEFAQAVVFLCSDAASYLTGVTLQADGGMVRSLL